MAFLEPYDFHVFSFLNIGRLERLKKVFCAVLILSYFTGKRNLKPKKRSVEQRKMKLSKAESNERDRRSAREEKSKLQNDFFLHLDKLPEG